MGGKISPVNRRMEITLSKELFDFIEKMAKFQNKTKSQFIWDTIYLAWEKQIKKENKKSKEVKQ